LGNKILRLLLTGSGAPGTSGTVNMLETGAASDQVKILIFGTDAKEPHSKVMGLEKSFQIPLPNSSNYLLELNRVIRQNSIDLVIPQTTAESAFLSQNAQLVESLVSVLPPEQFKFLNDKHLLLEHFSGAKIPHPRYELADSPNSLAKIAADFGYPDQDIVVKLPSSSGMRGVRLVSEHKESSEEFRNNKPNAWRASLRDLLETLTSGDWQPLLVMEFLSGPEYSVDVFRRGSNTVILPRVRNEMRAGISMTTTLELNEEIIQQTEQFLEHYEIEGLLGFQFILTGSGPRILECNPRIQGTMVASRLSGINLAWLEAKWNLDLPFQDRDFIKTSQTGVFRRSWGGSLSFADGSVETF
jgi:carbamoyl-phosphate synthase large subunit